jgi:5-methylcytosine-specific restriction endonuclease McrA
MSDPGSKYSLASYRRRRKALMDRIGRTCSKCGSRFRLQFNHLVERDWEPREVSRGRRMDLYERDFERGEIDLLCHICNATFKPMPRALWEPLCESMGSDG